MFITKIFGSVMKNFVLPLRLVTYTTLGILLANNANAQLTQTPQSNWLQDIPKSSLETAIQEDIQSHQITFNKTHHQDGKNEVIVSNQPPFEVPPQKNLQTTVLTSLEFKTKLANQPTTIVLPLSTPIELNRALSLAPTSSAGNKRYVLEVQVSFQREPTGTYDVYVNLPNIEATADKDTYYAGVISFFEVPSAERVTKTLLFDITEELLEQVRKRQQPAKIERLTLTFVKKDNTTSSEDIIIEKISLQQLLEMKN
jgi:hypothetical protein